MIVVPLASSKSSAPAIRWLQRIAGADDFEDANGTTIITYFQAIEEARKLARAGDPVQGGDRPVTVAEAIEAYKTHLAANDASPTNATMITRHLKPALAAKPVALLTRKDVLGFRNGILETVGRASAKRVTKSLCACLTEAARNDERMVNHRAWKDLPPLADADQANNLVLDEADV